MPLKNRTLTSKDLSNQIKEEEVNISAGSVRRTLVEEGLLAQRSRKQAKSQMTKSMIHQTRSVEHMCATDWEKVRTKLLIYYYKFTDH